MDSDVVESNLIFTAGNLLTAVLAFVFSIVIARLLQPQDFGVFTFVLTVAGFFVAFTDLGTSNIVLRYVSHYLSAKEEGKAKAVLLAVLKYRVVLILAVFLLLAGLHPTIAGLFGKPELAFFVFAAGVVLALNSAMDFVQITLLGLKDFRALFAVKVVEKLTRLGLALGLVLLGFRTVGAVSGVVLAYGVSIALAGLLIFRHRTMLTARRQAVDRTQIIAFGAWSLVHSVVIMIYSLTDSILLAALRPVEDVGFFGIASSWVMLITYLVPISSLALFPYFAEKEADSRLFGSSVRYTILIAVPLAFLVSAFSFPLITIFYGSAYTVAAQVVQVFSFVAIPIALNGLLGSFFIGSGKPHIPAKIITVAFAAAVVLNLLFIPLFGVVGAAYATLAARFIELGILVGASLMLRLKFPGRFTVKVLTASLAVYVLAGLLPVTNIFLLLAAGIGCMVVYAGLALGLKLLTVMEMKTAVRAGLKLFRGG